MHGIDGLYVADASIMPDVMSGNTNMPVTVIGERIARSLLGLVRPFPGGGVHVVAGLPTDQALRPACGNFNSHNAP